MFYLCSFVCSYSWVLSRVCCCGHGQLLYRPISFYQFDQSLKLFKCSRKLCVLWLSGIIGFFFVISYGLFYRNEYMLSYNYKKLVKLLAPVGRQAIIWTNGGAICYLIAGCVITNISNILGSHVGKQRSVTGCRWKQTAGVLRVSVVMTIIISMIKCYSRHWLSSEYWSSL